MAAEKKQTIVIKKITVVAGGGHGGSWKVAFADFMTAMMAFFLVMWLVGQSEDVKKSVADYFSTPSIIEYNFSNFGVELTLEKLFLDLVNEPLKAFEQFITPSDRKPNIMDMGLKKIQVHYLADKVGEFSEDMQVTSDEITFEIPEDNLFKKGTSDPAREFSNIMERIREIVEGLKDTDIYINSELPYKDFGSGAKNKLLAEERLDFIMNKVELAITNETVDMYGKITVEKVVPSERKKDMRGYIKFRIKQKDRPVDKKSLREAKDALKPSAKVASGPSQSGAHDDNSGEQYQGDRNPASKEDIYDSFVDQLTRKAEGRSGK